MSATVTNVDYIFVANSTTFSNVTDYGHGEISHEECACGDMSSTKYTTDYATYNLVVIIFLLPFVALFGLFSNAINVYVFTRPSMCSSANVYLLGLSCSDFMVVSTGVFIFCFDSARAYLPSLTEAATQGALWVLPVGYIAQTCSVYFTVAAAIDCYVKLCWHIFSRGWCSTRTAKGVAAIVTLFSIMYNTLRFWQFRLHDCSMPGHNETYTEVCPTQLFHDINVVYNVYMYMILMTVLPFMLLSFLNVLIVRTVQRVRLAHAPIITSAPVSAAHSNTTTVISASTNKSEENSDDSVITMVMVVVLFLACNTLALIVNIVETFVDPPALVIQFMTDTSNLLVVLNSSVNFVIYIFFDKSYRYEFDRLFALCCRRRRLVKNAAVLAQSSTTTTTTTCGEQRRRSDESRNIFAGDQDRIYRKSSNPKYYLRKESCNTDVGTGKAHGAGYILDADEDEFKVYDDKYFFSAAQGRRKISQNNGVDFNGTVAKNLRYSTEIKNDPFAAEKLIEEK